MDGLEIFAKVFEFWSLTQKRLLNPCSRQFHHWRRVLAPVFGIHVLLVVNETFEVVWILIAQGIGSVAR